ncbi:hypothetical protein E2C01_097459 [Portunus trituberculatus]|uniref:Uncharacterized protein n=1 Tax=Portunus trituberculatus TaxID=210409 RepID=A0A5B7K4I0_PORTR|nr:hypothetical protein [Portunus trituberculatus]
MEGLLSMKQGTLHLFSTCLPSSTSTSTSTSSSSSFSLGRQRAVLAHNGGDSAIRGRVTTFR